MRKRHLMKRSHSVVVTESYINGHEDPEVWTALVGTRFKCLRLLRKTRRALKEVSWVEDTISFFECRWAHRRSGRWVSVNMRVVRN